MLLKHYDLSVSKVWFLNDDPVSWFLWKGEEASEPYEGEESRLESLDAPDGIWYGILAIGLVFFKDGM